MATLTPLPPAPPKPKPQRPRRPVPPDDSIPPDGLIPGQPTGSGGEVPFTPPAKRRSVWPFITDLGLVMALFGLIIAGRPLIAIGAVIFVVALIGWIREARAEFSGLPD
jgi:hypothetical protein